MKSTPKILGIWNISPTGFYNFKSFKVSWSHICTNKCRNQLIQESFNAVALNAETQSFRIAKIMLFNILNFLNLSSLYKNLVSFWMNGWFIDQQCCNKGNNSK